MTYEKQDPLPLGSDDRPSPIVMVTLPDRTTIQLEYIRGITRAAQGYTLHMDGVPDYPLTYAEGESLLRYLEDYDGPHIVKVTI